MLLKIHEILLGESHSAKTNWEPFEQAREELYINPDRVSWLKMPTGTAKYAILRLDTRQMTISPEDGQRILDHHSPAPAAPTPASGPMMKTTEILSMTRDETRSSRSPMWRCGTQAGFTVNVFKHDDPLKDTFGLFDAAGYAPEMLAMNYGDTITWTRDSITVELLQNGSFWNVSKVLKRPDLAFPDEPEPEDDDTGSDNDPIIL